jgi:hypothetical protein
MAKAAPGWVFFLNNCREELLPVWSTFITFLCCDEKVKGAWLHRRNVNAKMQWFFAVANCECAWIHSSPFEISRYSVVNGSLVAFASHTQILWFSCWLCWGRHDMANRVSSTLFILFRPGEPGVYMRVSYYLNFINSIMNRGDQLRYVRNCLSTAVQSKSKFLIWRLFNFSSF